MTSKTEAWSISFGGAFDAGHAVGAVGGDAGLGDADVVVVLAHAPFEPAGGDADAFEDDVGASERAGSLLAAYDGGGAAPSSAWQQSRTVKGAARERRAHYFVFERPACAGLRIGCGAGPAAAASRCG